MVTSLILASCVLGAVLQYQPAGEGGSTYGQEFFRYDPEVVSLTLARPARPDRQMYLYYPGGAWVYGEDWCYRASDATIHLLRVPPRIYAPGGVAGAEIGPGTIIWIGYDPVSEPE